jgi:hypothetical protein
MNVQHETLNAQLSSAFARPLRRDGSAGLAAVRSSGRHADRAAWLQGGSVTTRGQTNTGGSVLCGDGNTPTPPFLPNEASCNVEENTSISFGKKELYTLQKNDNWLRFSRNAEGKRFLDKAGMTGLGIDRGDLRSNEVRGRAPKRIQGKRPAHNMRTRGSASLPLRMK